MTDLRRHPCAVRLVVGTAACALLGGLAAAIANPVIAPAVVLALVGGLFAVLGLLDWMMH